MTFQKHCKFSTIAFLFFLPTFSIAGFDEATKAYIFGDFATARYEALIGAEDGSAEAQMLLGQLYYRGEGVEKDLKAAVYWYEKAAQQGLKDAQFIVGNMYYTGEGINKNLKLAKRWLSEAAKNGNREAPDIIDTLFETETGEVVNLTESISFLQTTAEEGELAAQYLYGDFLVAGERVKQDKPKGVEYLMKAAKQGFIKAQKRLGELYALGDGVEQNYFESYGWSMAYAGTKELGGLSRVGVATARASLKRVPEEQIDIAYNKSKEYFEKYVLPFHPNARPVGPDEYRVVLYNRVNTQAAKAKNPSKPAPRIQANNQPPQKENQQPATPNKSSPTNADASKNSADPGTVGNSESEVKAVSTPAVSSAAKFSQTSKQVVESSGLATDTGQVGDIKKKLAEANSQYKASVEASSNKPSVNSEAADLSQEQSILANDQSTTEPENNVVLLDLPANRTIESIIAVLDEHKAKIFEMYKQAHAASNALAGRIEFELTIEPQGQVTAVNIVTSELENAEVFEQQLSVYLKAIDFGNQNVSQTVYTYPLNFQP